eukprot:5871336-Pyramimonas_sp.AAC.1
MDDDGDDADHAVVVALDDPAMGDVDHCDGDRSEAEEDYDDGADAMLEVMLHMTMIWLLVMAHDDDDYDDGDDDAYDE